MYTIINNSRAGMNSNQEKLNIVSNNIANVDTVGYKKINIEFSDLINETLNRRTYPTGKNKIDTGTGSKVTLPVRDLRQGPIRSTEIRSNLAIDGNGFFRVIKNDGKYAYTRDGNFSVDKAGNIVDARGNKLDVQFNAGYNYANSNITNENLNIAKDGNIYVDDIHIGKVNLYNSVGDDAFISIGDSQYELKDDAALYIENNSSIEQGYLEMSNVNLQDEMVEMITTQRAFQLNSKGMNVADDMWSMANNLRSK
ncbi:flagellar hook-basal body complex protein [Clostridioides mangenotii]|uniref:flagellar hook-basal body complex protein n=1 Tax=Metaclostridioides mangenotii TaxID=1540 RepID=UPI00214A07FD|nr:flagellar hook-basal body complex protein [Clostridioides mangenotii]MCR1953947.1 flagellar hook-basal body complex protein [Clostridioides mangenotii]